MGDGSGSCVHPITISFLPSVVTKVWAFKELLLRAAIGRWPTPVMPVLLGPSTSGRAVGRIHPSSEPDGSGLTPAKMPSFDITQPRELDQSRHRVLRKSLLHFSTFPAYFTTDVRTLRAALTRRHRQMAYARHDGAAPP